MGRIKRTKEQILKDIESQTKICCVCEERKHFDEFYNFNNKSDGKSYRCKVCDNNARSKWAKENPKKFRESQRRNYLWTKYRITPEDYNKLLKEQGGACAICGKLEEDNIVHGKFSSLSVDHNHDTGEVRGLLCNQCNRGIGMLGDTPEAIGKALAYLSH
jgi:hypothetical protein